MYLLTFMVVVADVADYKAMWLGRAADKLYTRVEPRAGPATGYQGALVSLYTALQLCINIHNIRRKHLLNLRRSFLKIFIEMCFFC